MSAWIVYSKDGKTERCRLKALEYSGSFMADRAVTATFECHSEVAFEVFDYIVYRGEKFELESVPSVKKTSSDRYEYELRFVSLKYELERCEMRDIVPNDNGVVYPTPLTFSFTGDVRYLAERIQANLDTLYGKDVWRIVVAENAVSEEKNITITQQNCWNALSTVNSTYGLNFSVRGREVVIGGELDSVDHTFQYGKGNGLYEIERASDTNTGIVTKLRAYGGTRNLDYSYPKKPEWTDSVLPVSFALSPLRLMLPSFKEDGKTDFVLADEATIAEYGIREASIIYEDIYPSITGATNANGEAIDEIAGVDEIDESKSTFVVYLRDLGFDLNEHLTTSEAQLSMKTGTLQGYTFTLTAIERLQNGGYKITLGRNSLENSEETGAYVPSKNWNMKAGDKFVLLNILMPQAYIREAEQRLLARAKEYLAEYSKTNFSYNVGLHDKFLVEHTSVYDSLIEGVKLNVYDAELGISEYVTIQSITITEDAEDNILPQVKVTLNNKPSASTLDRIQGKLNDVIAETSANSFSSQSELMKQYRKKLDKPFFDKLFSAVDADGNEIASNDMSTPIAYIKAKYDFLVLGGVTMYGDDDSLNLPSIYEGLPIDNVTLYWDKGVLKAKGGEEGGEADSIAWANVYGKPSWITDTKPIYNYSEIKNTPDLSVFVTGTALSNTLADYATLTYLTGELKKYVTLDGAQDIKGVKNFVNGLKIGGMPITKMQDDVIYIDANLVVRGGVTMYSDNEVDIPSIKDEIGFAGYNGSVGLASFDSSQFVISANGTVSVKGGSAGLDTAQLKDYLDSNKYTTETWVKAQGYASASSLSLLQTKVDNFLEGSDTDTIINKWKELEVFLSGLSESDNLANILSTKWTTDNNLINQWNTAYGWGDHSKVGYALKSYVDSNFVTLGTKQTITGEKNFTGGLRVNNSPSIYYDATNKYWKLEGDLLVTGGVTMYGSDDSDFGSIFDEIPIDGDTIYWSNGVLKAKSSGSGGGSVSGDYLPLSGGTLTGSIILGTASTTSHLSYYIRRNGNIIGLGSDYYNTCLRFSPSTGGSHFFKLSDTGMHYSADTGNTWSEVLYAGNYSNYALPLSGGSLQRAGTDTPLRIIGNTTGAWIAYAISTDKLIGYFGVQSDNQPYFAVNNNAIYKILHEGNYSSYALPLTGGTIYNSKNDTPLNLRSGDTETFIGFYDTVNTLLGYIGIDSSKQPTFYDTTNRRILTDANYSNYALPKDGTAVNASKVTNALSWSGYSSGSYNGSAAKSITIPSNTNQLTNGAGFITSSASITGNAGSANYLRTQYSNSSDWHGGYLFYCKWGTDDILDLKVDNYLTRADIAKRLNTARTLWGQSFNGTANVSGNIKGSYFTIADRDKAYIELLAGSYLGYVQMSSNGSIAIGPSLSLSVIVTQAGKIGMGTENPYSKLEVKGCIYANNGSTSMPSFRWNKNGSYWGGIGYNGIANYNEFGSCNNDTWVNADVETWRFRGNIISTGGITMYSDIRKKTILNHVELSLKQIANAPLIQHYYNSDQEKTTHVGSIAQYWAGLNDWFCKLDNEGFYTMEIQNCALASAISIARHLEKYESKTDKKIRMLKKRVQELEDKLERLEGGNYGC